MDGHELTIRPVNEPLVYGVYKILLMSAKAVIRTGNFHYRNLDSRRCAFEESVGHVRVCQTVSQAMDDENRLRNSTDVFVWVGNCFRAPEAYHMVSGVKCFAQWSQIDQHPLVSFTLGDEILGLVENLACSLYTEYAYIPFEQIAGRPG